MSVTRDINREKLYKTQPTTSKGVGRVVDRGVCIGIDRVMREWGKNSLEAGGHMYTQECAP